MTQQGNPGFSAEMTSQEKEALVAGQGGEFNAFISGIAVASTVTDAMGDPTTQLVAYLVLRETTPGSGLADGDLTNNTGKYFILRHGTNMLNPLTGVAEQRNNQPAYWKGTFRNADLHKTDGNPPAGGEITGMRDQGIDLITD